MLQWCDEALRVAVSIQHNPGPLLIAKGRLEAALGNGDAAIQCYQQAINVSDRSSLVYAQALLGLVSTPLYQGKYQGILEELQRIASLLQQQGHPEYAILVDYHTAMYDFRHGKYETALSSFVKLDNMLQQNAKLAQLYPGTEVVDLQYNVRFAIGCVYRKRAFRRVRDRHHNYQKAREYHESLYKESKEQVHREMEAATAHHLGWIHLHQEDTTQALKYAQEALEGYRKLNQISGMADVYEQLGLIHIAIGQPETGLPLIQCSLDLRNQIDNKHGAASSMRRIAIAQFHLKQWWQAITSLRRSLHMYHSAGLLNLKRFIGIILELLEWTIGRKRLTL